MPVVVVESVAPIASWRPPEALTFHPTYPLPPFTALVGTLSAAMGLALQDGYSYIAENDVKLGVGGWNEGRLRDLWKYQKLKSKQAISAVILREHLVDMRMCFVIEVNSQSNADEIANAFSNPAYPLTAGQSDSLLHAVSVSIQDLAVRETRTLQDALIYAELSPNYTLVENLDKIPLFQSIVAPTVHRIPTGFSFDESGHRSLASRELVTFVGNRVEVEEPVRGYEIKPQSRFFRSKGLMEWIIPVHRFD